MRKISTILIGLLLAGIFNLPAWAGTLATNEFIYKPSLGAKGDDERNRFHAGLDRVDTRLGKEIWVGDPLYGATLQTAITAIGATPTILRVPAGTHSITANLSTPATLTLKPERGAIFAIATDKTLTINGTLDAGPYQIFSCTGTGKVSFASTSPQLSLGIYPDWWGLNGSTDQVAINAAIKSTPANYGGVILLPNTYACNDEITNSPDGSYRGRLTFEGTRGNLRSHVIQTGTGKNAFTITGPSAGSPVYQITFKGLFIEGGAATGCGILFQDVAEVKVDDCYINQHGSHGIYFPATAAATFNGYIQITRSWFGYNKGDGIRGIASAVTPNLLNSVVVSDCDIMSDDYTATRTGVNICGNNVSILRGTIQGFKYGIQLPGGSGAGYNIDNIYFEGSGKVDIYAGAVGPNNTGSIKNCRSTRVYHNVFMKTASQGAFRGFELGPNYVDEHSAAITGLSKAAACVVTVTAKHLLATGDKVTIDGITQAEWSALNGTRTITYIDDYTFSIPVNTSGYTLAYDPATDPGVVYYAKAYDFADNTFLLGTINLGQITPRDCYLPLPGTGSVRVIAGSAVMEGPTISTLSGDGTFTSRDALAILTPSGASRNYNPSGYFIAGHRITVMNVSATYPVVFDSAGIAVPVMPGRSVSFIYTGSAWLREAVSPASGTCTLLNTGVTTTDVANVAVTATSRIFLNSTSSTAAAAVGSATGVWVSAKSAGVGFTITHPASPGATATMDYSIVN